MPRCPCPTCQKDALEGEWEYVNAIVIDDIYDGSGIINAPEVNGSIFIQDGDQAKALVEAHNAILRKLSDLPPAASDAGDNDAIGAARKDKE